MGTPKASEALVRLSDSGLTLHDPTEDIRGRRVVDVAGEDLGKVDDLFIDERQQKVRFLEVSTGGFLGLGATKFLLPVDAIARLADDVVYVNQSRERVAGAPRYDPTLVEERYVSSLYSHYGYPPYWGPDYDYPGYPYYPSGSPAADEAERDAFYRRSQTVSDPSSGREPFERNLMPIKEIMTREVEVIHPEATLWEAAQKMATLDVGPLPVCTGDQLVGMLTDRDITVRATAQGRDPKTTRVHEIMTPDIIYAFEDDDVSEAARIMREQQIRRVAVLNQSKQLVGIVSLGDLSVYTGDARQVGETLEAVSEPSEP